MKILKFSAENVKGIKVIEIEPQGEDVTLSGANEAGKTSVLDTIERILCGGKLELNDPEKPGSGELDLGEYVVSRKITGKTDRIVVKNKDGASYPKPREFLAKLIGPMAINPLAFVNLKEEKQRLEVIFQLLPELEGDLAKSDKKISDIREVRSDINKDKKRLDVELAAAPFHEDVPGDLVSVADLSKEFNEANKNNEEIRSLKEDHDKASEGIRGHLLWVEKLNSQIAELEKKIEIIQGNIKDRNGLVESLKTKTLEIDKKLNASEMIDVLEITKKMDDAEEINDKIRQNWSRNEISSKLAEAIADYSVKGHDLANAEQEKALLLANAEMPIKGLSVDGGVATYNGVPMSEICFAERVRVGASVAVAQKPQAEIILVDNASLLDSKNMAILHEICKDLQVWQVINDESGDIGFFIEEGEIKAKE